jgi:hypothetical protein
MAEREAGSMTGRGLTVASWPPQFESDLDRIPWLVHGRPRSFLEFRLLDMEEDQRIFHGAQQKGRLGRNHYLYRWEWRLIGFGKVPVWFTLDDRGSLPLSWRTRRLFARSVAKELWPSHGRGKFMELPQ